MVYEQLASCSGYIKFIEGFDPQTIKPKVDSTNLFNYYVKERKKYWKEILRNIYWELPHCSKLSKIIMCEDNDCLKPYYGSDIKLHKNPVMIGNDSPILMIEQNVKNQDFEAIFKVFTANNQDEYLIRIGMTINIPDKVINSSKFDTGLGTK